MFVQTGARKGHLRAHWLLLAAAVSLACPAWAQFAGPTEGAATVTFLTGRVDILRDNTPWALNVGDFVKPGRGLR